MRTQVAIVGGGLAGLCCARRLAQESVDYLVLEAADEVGGRVRTDLLEGFQLDRGFQVLLTAYPEAREVLDYQELDLGAFHPGALVWFGGKFHRVTDPWRKPLQAVASLWSPIGTFTDKLRVGRLRNRLLRKPEGGLAESTTLDALRREGFSASMMERFFRPFLGGVFLERELETSSRFFEFVFRMFATGETALPARGMGAIPKQIAGKLADGSVRTGCRASRLEAGKLTLDSGEIIQADKIVVATNSNIPGTSAHLRTGTAWRSATCLYFRAPQPPLEGPLLVLNGEGAGPVNSLVVLTEVVPAYSESGEALISVTVPGNPEQDDQSLRATVVRQLSDWFAGATEKWDLLRVYRIARALPAFPPEVSADYPSSHLGIVVCGDLWETPSIQGAMVSGRKAAEAILGARTGAA